MQLIDLILVLIYTGIFLAVSFFDLKERRVPNNIMFPAIVLGFIAMFYRPGWQSGLLGAALGAGIMLLPVLTFGKKGGMGDVKLAFFMGLILGYPGILVALIIAHVSTIFLWVGILLKKLTRKSLIPFAPFLSFGALVILFLPFFL